MAARRNARASLGAAGIALAALSLLAPPRAHAQRFLPDDPVAADPDDLPIPKPRPLDVSRTFDFLENTFSHHPGARIPRAVNVNTLGEVPDSSWFTNRAGSREMPVEDLVRGPNQIEGPDLSSTLTVTAGKTVGVTPGFTMKDPRGEVFFVKVDPLDYPHMLTAADVIGTKFFHAFGYNVPENYLARLRPEQLVIGDGARVTGADGKKRAMEAADLDAILDRCPREPDGTIRVVASRRLAGEPLGEFKFHGTRSDDANDIFPHQDRRELRGLRVFAAWLNHDDSDALNTLDAFVKKGEGGYVRHHLIDFGAILGSSSVGPQRLEEGYEYAFDLGPLLRSALTFGIWDRSWRSVPYREYPEIGRIEADYFRPDRWKPFYPNPAFDRMLPEDALWATRIVVSFTDEKVRAVVGTGEFRDPEAERYLADTLLKRRDKVVAYHLHRANPLVDFEVRGGAGEAALRFVNLAEQVGLARGSVYEYEWLAFDNTSGELRSLGPATRAESAALPLPGERPDYLVARIRTLGHEERWRKRVDVFIRNAPVVGVVGVEREN
jgi:hypothetical protein